MNREKKNHVLARDKWRCHYCRCRLIAGENATVDHKLALSKGGTNAWSNLVASCKDCNSNKASLDYFCPPRDRRVQIRQIALLQSIWARRYNERAEEHRIRNHEVWYAKHANNGNPRAGSWG